MQHNDDGSDEAYCAANLAQKAKLFVQKVCSQYSADEHREGSEGCHENGGRKCVSGKVEDLAEDHCLLSVALLS